MYTYLVGCEVSSTTSLLDYLRYHLNLHGTKYMCKEGGCGACMVSVVKNQGEERVSINSCLVLIMSCHGWDIETIEKVGNRLEGYHPLQKTLAENNGSQCGYCSPGMVMNMYSFLKSKPRTMMDIERALGSNLCRCTGYRPILKAFKQFASDASTPSSLSIEDLKICGSSDGCCSSKNKSDDCCSKEKSGGCCSDQKSDQSDWCMVSRNEVHDEMLHIKLKDNRDWYRITKFTDIFDLWDKYGLESYMLVAGNTVKGAIPINAYSKLLMDINGIPELRGYYLDQNLFVAGGNTLGQLMDILNIALEYDGFSYVKEVIDHLDLVAHVAIRNLGTIAGNLMIKKQSPGFQSDIYLFLETIGGQITILQSDGLKRVLSMQGFLKEDMTGKIILDIVLPPLAPECKVRTYKIMPRSQSVHALVNAGFYYKLDESNIVEECRLVFGALSTNFSRANKTERYLVGKDLFTNETLKGALDILVDELVITEHLTEPPVAYRRNMALGLFYKGLLSLCPENTVAEIYRSGAVKHRETRPTSEGHQVTSTNQALWPITKPIPKIDGLIQCAGEAEYTDDVPLCPNELHIAFVLAKVVGTIQNIDATKALAEPGVVAFYSAKDIPGVNSFIPAPNGYNLANEELFCDGIVKFFDQPIGMIVAESQAIAIYASNLVEVSYTNQRKPVIDINDARKDSKRVSLFQSVKATSKGTDVVKVIKGNNTIYGQYHSPMETLVCVARPTEDGLQLHATTQWMDLVHQAVSRVLKMDQSRIVVICPRIGGAYGMKIGRANQVSVATAMAAHLLNRPCRMATPLTVNMRAMGKRMPCSRDFEVGVNANGEIQYVNCDLYGDNGYVVNEPLLALGMDVYSNCYDKNLWNYTCYNVLTDTPSNTWCRSPGTLENIAMAEIMMERIACEMKLNPMDVRTVNLAPEVRDDMLDLIEKMKANARYDDRKEEVETFNKNNRFTKRGLRFSLLKWEPVGSMYLPVNIAPYADDGSVIITHGGIEMGQGVNTKAIQIASYILKIPMDKIKIKANNTIIVPNGAPSGGSITSQNVGIGVRRCCEELMKRLEPIKLKMSNPTWKELIQKAKEAEVDLQVHACTTSADVLKYNICGIALTEVEVDVLTGEFQVRRLDLIEDVGQSISPELDIGQIEGALMMGLGYWTSENLAYDPQNGELVTNRTWMYWPPQALDIPQDLRLCFKNNGYSTEAVYGAKGTGEPATCLSVGVMFALRAAIESAREDCGLPADEWFQIDGPMTLDKICMATGTKPEHFKFY